MGLSKASSATASNNQGFNSTTDMATTDRTSVAPSDGVDRTLPKSGADVASQVAADNAAAEGSTSTGDAANDGMIQQLKDMQALSLKTSIILNTMTARYDMQKKIADAIRV